MARRLPSAGGGLRADAGKEKARRRWYRRGPWRVIVRFASTLTLEQYLARKAWVEATLERCPLHPEGRCGLSRHGTYKRVYPVTHLVTRYYCPVGHVTFSLLPDCLAAGMMGTLEQAERSAAAAEQGVALEPIADEIRPSEQLEDPDSVVEPASVVQWMKRRHRSVLAGLVVIAGLMPEFFAQCPTTLEGFAQRLDTDAVLVTLRQVAAEHLQHVPAPIGFLVRRGAKFLGDDGSPTIDAGAPVDDLDSARVVGPRSPPDQE